MNILFQKIKALLQKAESIDIDYEKLVGSLSWKDIRGFILNEFCSDTERFRIVMAGDDYPKNLVKYAEFSNKPRIDLLSKANAEFFYTFNYFSISYSDFHTDISYVGISELEPNFVRIAYDMGHEIVSRPKEDTVFFLDWDVDTADIEEPWLDYTIWHYAFDVAITVYPELLKKLEKSMINLIKKESRDQPT